jgi:hypothetical protein
LISISPITFNNTSPVTTNTKAFASYIKTTSHHITSIKMSKLITVFGATGNQGGSVIKHILADAQLSSEFKIRGITRDVKKPAAKALADRGVELTTVSLPCVSQKASQAHRNKAYSQTRPT